MEEWEFYRIPGQGRDEPPFLWSWRCRRQDGTEDSLDRWIRMVATNRLTGHSPGFFSVYTLPPNQAALPESQIRINEKLGQAPQYRDVRALILRKSMQLQSTLNAGDRWRLHRAAAQAAFARLLSSQSLTPPQIRFVEMIIDQLTARGVMEPGALYEAPFIGIHAGGPDGLFAGKDELIAGIFHTIQATQPAFQCGAG